jgi:hypothetical protein
MANGRHSYVAFYPSDWLGGTARLPRLHRSVYFDVCCYNWDLAAPCPAIELSVMISDLKGGSKIVDELVAMGKLIRNDDGSVENPKALAEARKALAAWEAMSKGGKGRGKGDSKGVDKPHTNGAATEPEPKIEAKASSAETPDAMLGCVGEIARAAGVPTVDQGRIAEQRALVKSWLDAGADESLILATVRTTLARAKSPPNFLRYFDAAVREAITAKAASANEADRLIADIRARKAQAA